jgi:hypothetical protein
MERGGRKSGSEEWKENGGGEMKAKKERERERR